jgi:hypothetical protein
MDKTPRMDKKEWKGMDKMDSKNGQDTNGQKWTRHPIKIFQYRAMY